MLLLVRSEGDGRCAPRAETGRYPQVVARTWFLDDREPEWT